MTKNFNVTGDGPDTSFKLNRMHVSAKDISRAKVWYEKILLKRGSDMETDRFDFWMLGGVYFGMFNPELTKEQFVFGNNCVPNLEVNQLDQLH